MTRITHEQLIAFAAGELDGPQADEVAAHLAADPDAARSVALYRTAAIATQKDDATHAPADMVTRAKAIFRAEAPARRGVMDRLQDVIAHLVYDSRLQPAATRSAAAAERIQLAFEAGDYEIDLRAEEIAPEAHAGTASWRVVGQVLSEKAIGAVAVTVLAADATVVAAVDSDERALFKLDLPEGNYDVRIELDGEVITLNGVEIG